MILPFLLLASAATQNAPLLDGGGGNADVAKQQCELHVWPSEGTNLMHHGIWDSFQAGSSMYSVAPTRQQVLTNSDSGPTTKTPLADGPLKPAEQVELLKSINIQKFVNLPGHMAVFHDTPLDSKTLRTQTGRYAESSTDCYADLVVDDIVYSRVYGKAFVLKSYLRFRDFGAQATAKNSFGTWVETKLEQDPRKENVTEEAVVAELKGAYSKNFEVFAGFMTANAKKGKKSR